MQPNLKEYTLAESGDLVVQIMELDEQGRFEEAQMLRKEIPLIPGIANNAKNRMGIQALIESGVNLSKAVNEYGNDWLKS